jgi:hypothetical protein
LLSNSKVFTSSAVCVCQAPNRFIFGSQLSIG